MNNKIILITLTTFLMLFSGCGLVGDSDGKQSGISIGSGSSSSGGAGVKLDFAEGQPGNEMFKDQPAYFAFIFTNYQDHDITDLKLKPYGFDWDYVKGLNKEYSVQKISRANEKTGPGIYRGLREDGVTVTEGGYNFNPKFDYCYSATSLLEEQICISEKGQSTCNLDYTHSVYNNGPLTIKIDSTNSVDNIRLFFSAKNTAGGKIIDECFSSDDYYANYKIKTAKLGEKQGDCKPMHAEDYIIDNDNTKTGYFYCDFKRSSDSAYATKLTIELEHKYQQTKEQKISVTDLEAGY